MTTRRADWMALALACAAFAAIFARSYPPLSGVEDEVGFVNQALVWSRGALSLEASGFVESGDPAEAGERAELMDFIEARGRHVASRHPGRSLILLPFTTIGGVRAGFLSGLAIHLATTLAGAALLARGGRSPAWAVLILCHPTLAIYSRTILADEAAGGCLLLAALMATVPGRGGAAAAGFAAGLAALMRYHAGLGLPIVAAAIALDPARARRRGDGLACLVAGGAVGGLIVAYNLMLYGAPLDAPGSARGEFGARFIAENAPFYAVALMTFWPGMLPAPALDRSPTRWIARGVAATYFAFLSAYYFHDRAGGRIETLAVGLRLMQVALPLWIASYAAVVDDRVAAPLRSRAGPRAATAVGLALGVLLLGATGFAFRKHQAHLLALASARRALIAETPPGSLIVEVGAVHKLFGIADGGPVYRWCPLVFQGKALDCSGAIGRARAPWMLAILNKGASPPAAAIDLIARHDMRHVETGTPALTLYRSGPRSGSDPP